MPSLNVDLNYFDNVKTMRLVARLGPGADVLPIKLWAYVGKHNPTGGALAMLEAELEFCVGWWGERGAFARAMVEVGFVTRDGDNWFVHDWLEHSGHLAYFKRRAKIAAEAKWGVGERLKRAKMNRSARMARARKLGRHTQEEWFQLTEFLGRVCVRCLQPDKKIELVKDHIKPVYQGGSDAILNIQPLCRGCNASKGRDNIDYRLITLRKRYENESDDGLLKRLLDACLMPALTSHISAVHSSSVHNKKSLRKTFVPPTAQEITAYAKGIGYKLDGEKFVAHYAARGWVYGAGQPMKDWRAAVVTWKKKAGPHEMILPPKAAEVLPPPEDLVAHDDVTRLLQSFRAKEIPKP